MKSKFRIMAVTAVQILWTGEDKAEAECFYNGVISCLMAEKKRDYIVLQEFSTSKNHYTTLKGAIL